MGSGSVKHDDFLFSSFEEMQTLGSRGWRKADGYHDVGNPWVKDAWLVSVVAPSINIYGPFGTYYEGPVCSTTSRTAAGSSLYYRDTTWPALPAADISLSTAGATAISRCAPTVPASDTLVAIGEIAREGIPSMVGSTLKKDVKRYQSYGDEYLNYQFGWAPFVRDLRKLSKAVYESDDIVKRLTEGSGKHTRRRYSFPSKESTSTWEGAGLINPPLPTGYLQSKSNRIETTRTESRTWFSGAFTYHANLRGSSSWERVEAAANRARHLYGIKLTPDVMWSLMPWSWLVDWQTNIGDVISNVSLFANDGLVMHYGYVMQHRSATRDSWIRGTFKSGIGAKNLSDSLTRDSKVRVRASPWGFGVDPINFTSRQIAILAALGISRM